MPTPSLTKVAAFSVALSTILNMAPAHAQQKPATVRVTTGTVVTAGWEQNLVHGNPNLGHWHWDPIYSNVTGYEKRLPGPAGWKVQKTRSGQFIPAAPPRHSVYDRPVHLPMNMEHKTPHNPIIVLSAPKPPPPMPSVSAILAQKKLNATLAQNKVSAMLSQNKVSGVLSQDKVQGVLADRQTNAVLTKPVETAPAVPASPVIATYSGNYRPPENDFACLTDQSSQFAKSSVSANIAHPKAVHSTKSAIGF